MKVCMQSVPFDSIYLFVFDCLLFRLFVVCPNPGQAPVRDSDGGCLIFGREGGLNFGQPLFGFRTRVED